MDADPELDLVLGQLEAGSAGRRHDAGTQPDPEGPGPVVDLAAERSDRRQVETLFGGRADDLLDEHGRTGTAPARRPPVVHRHVVVDQHRLDPDAVDGGEPCGHLEVEHVAGVVLHDVQHPGAAIHRLGSGQYPVGYRRGEHLTRAGRVQHPVPDIAAVQRLVP